jgi:hypothetical protein
MGAGVFIVTKEGRQATVQVEIPQGAGTMGRKGRAIVIHLLEPECDSERGLCGGQAERWAHAQLRALRRIIASSTRSILNDSRVGRTRACFGGLLMEATCFVGGAILVTVRVEEGMEVNPTC